MNTITAFGFKIRGFLLSACSLLLVGGMAAGDFHLRHEIRAKSIREIKLLGFTGDIDGLISAIRGNRLEILPLFDSAEVDFGAKGSDGDTPLVAAISAGNDSGIKAVLSRKSARRSVAVCSSEGIAPVDLAVEKRNYPLAGKLIRDFRMHFEGINRTGDPCLIKAVRDHDDELIEFLLEQQIDVNRKSLEGDSAFTLAFEQRDLPLMRSLIEHGAETAGLRKGDEPLEFVAAKTKAYEELDLLLSHGADPDWTANDGTSALGLAVRTNDGRLAKILLDHGVGAGNKDHLFHVFEAGNRELLEMLLDYGASIDSFDSREKTILMRCVENSDLEMTGFAIVRKANLNLKNSSGDSALSLAVAKGNSVLVNKLIDSGAEAEAAMTETAFLNHDLPTLSVLLKAGADSEGKIESRGKSMMEIAVEEPSHEMVELLLDNGAGIGRHFLTALKNGDRELVSLFLARGADPGQKGPDGAPVLDFCLRNDWLPMTKLLLRSGADPNLPYAENESWLAHLIQTGNEETALALLEADADLGDERTADGHSMLAWSVARRTHRVSMALVKRGVDVNIIEPTPSRSGLIELFPDEPFLRRHLEEDRRMRPLILVATIKDYELAQAMVQAGAEDLSTNEYIRPVKMAARNDDIRMIRILCGRDPDKEERKIVIDLSRQRVEFYQDGKLTLSSLCSTGKSGHRTPAGRYAITEKDRYHHSNLYGNAPMPYFMRLSCEAFGLHIGNCPGYPASHGCIRLPSSTAIRLYQECELGDLVVIQD